MSPVHDPLGAMYKVAAEQFLAKDWLKDVAHVSGNCVLSNDDHIPKHNPLKFRRIAQIGRLRECPTLVLGGDTTDHEELTSHPQAGPPVAAADSITRTLKILGELLNTFDRIVLFGGNHCSIRLIRTIERATRSKNSDQKYIDYLEHPDRQTEDYETRYLNIMNDWTKRVLGGDRAKRIEWHSETHCILNGVGNPWIYSHQKVGSKKAPYEAMSIWMANPTYNVITTHTHLFGLTIAPDGVHVLANLGGGTEARHNNYAVRHDTGYHQWVTGLGALVDGVLTPYPFNPNLTNWPALDYAMAVRQHRPRPKVK